MKTISKTKKLIAWYRLFFGVLGFAAVTVQLMHGLQRDTFSILNFFSFFTIESNVLAASILVISAWLMFTDKQQLPDTLRGIATVAMAMTGVIYALLLAGLEASLQTSIPWVNAVLHYVMPMAVFLDWFLHPPMRAISTKQAWTWLLFPLLYVVYSLVRGYVTHWYPYPFLNVALYGLPKVLAMASVIAVGVVAFVSALVFLTNARIRYQRRR